MRTYQRTALLTLINMIYFTVDIKATPVAVQGVSVDF
jgi:hypothetical protein